MRMGLLETIREVTRSNQMKELYRGIGEFAVAFELVSHAERSCIVWLLASAGLRDQNIVQILLANRTAEPLRTLLQSLIGHMRPPNPDEEKIVKNILDRHKRLIERRNEVLHGTWFIGYGNEDTTDWSTAHGVKVGKNKGGVKTTPLNYSAAEFDVLTQEANELTKLINRLDGCFLHGRAVEKNFEISDDGGVSTR